MIKAIKLFIGYILRSLGASFVIIWDIRMIPLATAFARERLDVFVILCFFIVALQSVEFVFIANIGTNDEAPLENKIFLYPAIIIIIVVIIIPISGPRIGTAAHIARIKLINIAYGILKIVILINIIINNIAESIA